MEIKVNKRSDDEYLVVITSDDGSSTEHIVNVSDEVHQKLTGGICSKELLIEKSIEFLLEREPKEAILQGFEIMKIAEYFPEYPDEIKKVI
tara:strand:- start:927 stop:1199 length:273 start_codon:yes stop_codon:yes gene_type:complete